jgi:FAD/FMN-containing dehydrogenase
VEFDKLVQGFAQNLRGELIQPGDQNYDEARKLYNAMIDRRPRFIVRCADVADVIASVKFARDHNLLLAVRGGGHNGGGLGSCDDGLVIDLSRMKGVRVDPEQQTAQVNGGCTWGDVDHATHVFGLATPSGIISTTGVGGLTLGGGLGHLTRRFGLAVDNLIGADMVLADGSFVSVSASNHPDLFWAIRGGGGNFGVVTSFLFRLHPVKTVIAGPTLWPLEQSADVLKWYREFITKAPEELNGFFAFLVVPPGPPFPEHLHLKKMCGVVWCYTGTEKNAEAVFKPIRDFGPPALYGVQAMPFPAIQSAFDGLYPPGHQWYWKADFVDKLSDQAIALHVEHGSRLPTMQSTMHLYPIDGAARRVGRNDTAFSYRDATWAEVIVGVDPDPANAKRITSWAKEYWDALHPYSAGGAYVNFMMEEGQDRVKDSYRDNYKRLAATKAKYDPNNLFRVNQNIQPAN